MPPIPKVASSREWGLGKFGRELADLIMSTSYTATVIYGYCLPRTELVRSKPNPLYGKVKFDPETGEKVTKFLKEHVELGIDCGDRFGQFIRFDTGYEERDHILLGVRLAKADLACGAPDPEKLKLLSDEDCFKVQNEVEELLAKAGIAFDPKAIGYYLAGYVG